MIRNIAIIAHVDHGKTTLVDKMLRQAGVFGEHEHVAERVMDSNPLERERGITIFSKNAAVRWEGTKINLVDTPGHADFGGEVERILRMVDGVLLLVCAAEGPMPQTRFVTRKALALGLMPIIVINKVDRPDADPLRVHDEVLDLLIDLEALPEQLDATFLYGSSREGYVSLDDHSRSGDLQPLFEAIVRDVPAPSGAEDEPFQMLISTFDHSPYLGRLAIGRIERGRVAVGDSVVLLPVGDAGMLDESEGTRGKAVRLYRYEGLERKEIERAAAGDIIALAGLEGAEIGKTVTAPERTERLAGIAVEEPTMAIDVLVNNSPFSGRDGKYVTSRQIRERLFREVERNVAMRVEETDSPDTFTVSGRGELHLGILLETMRREGYEFQVARPRVILQEGQAGERLEPYEELIIDVAEEAMGAVIEKLGPRRGEMLDMQSGGHGTVRLRFRIPARGLFGYRSEFLTDTRGTGVMHHRFMEYGPWAGPIAGRNRGVLVSDREGTAVGYALFGLQERSTLFVGPGTPVYAGMIVGENSRPDDMDVNPTKEKKLTNIRAAGADDAILLEPPRELTLELALQYIAEDEYIEVTPTNMRLRKRALDVSERRKLARQLKK